MEEQETSIAGRKRPLDLGDSDDQRDSDSNSPASKVPAVNSVLDEIELHFKRSLAKVKPNQGSTSSSIDGNHTLPSKPLVIYQPSDRHNRDSPSPNQQSRRTPPISSSSSSSSLSSSPRRHVVGNNKPLPPPLKLASPTSDTPSSNNTVQSLHLHSHPQPHHSRASHPQAIILPTISTTAGLTGLSRASSSSVQFSSSPPSTVSGLPTLTINSNGLPRPGNSPPSSFAKTYNTSGITQLQTLPAISAAALSNAGSGGVYPSVIPVASPQHIFSSAQQQQRVLHQQSLSNGSSSPKQRSATSNNAPTTTVHLANSGSGLAAVQLTPGGPILALPSSGLQPNVSNSSSILAPRALVTGIPAAGGGGGGYQLTAPSVTQPGSVQIINIPDDSCTSGGLIRTSPPAPLLASAPTLPKAPTVLNVSQIPNLIAINPSSPSSPSPSNKTPTVKVLGVSGTQSPIRVSAASTQTTPVATPTVITPQQLAANPSLMSIMDPTISSQLLTAGNSAGGPLYIIPASGMPMVQQPFYIINPSTSAAELPSLPQTNVIAANPSLAGASLISNPAGGYFLVSPGHGAPANFSMPLVNLASTASINSSQPAVPSLVPTSPAVSVTTLKPANVTTILNSASVGGSAKLSTSKPPVKNQNSSDSAPSPSHDDVMMTPASVDDHFAQALGPQWNKLKSHNNMQPQQC